MMNTQERQKQVSMSPCWAKIEIRLNSSVTIIKETSPTVDVAAISKQQFVLKRCRIVLTYLLALM